MYRIIFSESLVNRVATNIESKATKKTGTDRTLNRANLVLIEKICFRQINETELDSQIELGLTKTLLKGAD